MSTRFDFCVSFVLRHETEYNRDGSVKVERDPNDPGGTTKYGIDQRDHPHVDVANLTEAQAREIFFDEVWQKCRCAEFKVPWDLVIMDSAVNPGFGWCVPNLQRVVATKADGFIGPKTIAATNESTLTEARLFLVKREAYYRARPATLNGKPFRTRFLAGWLARVDDLRKAAGIVE